MSSEFPPIDCKKLKAALSRLGFAKKAQNSSSHEQWERVDPPKRKVTVDCPKAPFTATLMKYMAEQAGISKNELYDACLERGKWA